MLGVLKELSKQDALWRKYALSICKNKDLADDLVNDMYLKLYQCKEFNQAYVYRVLKSIFIDQIRKNKIKFINIHDVKNIPYEDTNTNDRYDCLEILKDVDIYTKEILLTTHEMSLRDAEEELNVAYYTLNYYKNKGLKQLRKKHG